MDTYCSSQQVGKVVRGEKGEDGGDAELRQAQAESHEVPKLSTLDTSV